MPSRLASQPASTRAVVVASTPPVPGISLPEYIYIASTTHGPIPQPQLARLSSGFAQVCSGTWPVGPSHVKRSCLLPTRAPPPSTCLCGLSRTEQQQLLCKALSSAEYQPGPPRAVLKATVSGELVQIYTLKSGRYPPTSGSRIALSGGDTSSSVLSPSAGLGGAGSNYPQQPCSWTLSHGLKTLVSGSL